MERSLKYNTIIHGDCYEVLKNGESNSIDLIITSPPYAGKRGFLPSHEYVKWFLPRSKIFMKVLKRTGSLVIIIKEGAKNGERETYILELIIEMRKQGWLWVEDYIWHKKNAAPGKWPNRFRDTWEHCLHFTKQREFRMYQDSVKVAIGTWVQSRKKNPSKGDFERRMSKTNSGIGTHVEKWFDKTHVYPSNVLVLPTVSDNKNHNAVFPEKLVRWFIKLFTKPGDIVLDPFIGSGTTAIAAKRLKRRYIGIEKDKEICINAKNRVERLSSSFFED